MSIDEDTPNEISSLEDGYYLIEGENQYFKIETTKLYLSDGYKREMYFPLFKSSVIEDYLSDVYERKEQELLGETLAEITDFKNDLYTELVWENDIAKMKPYYNKQIYVKRYKESYTDFNGVKHTEYRYKLHLNGQSEVEIYVGEGTTPYSAYDGVEGYGWYSTIKEAVKSYMEVCYNYPTDEIWEEPKCSNCGDGGCIYCSPSDFL